MRPQIRTILRCSVLLTVFGLCSCAPQSYYSQYPYSRAGYYSNAAATQQRNRPRASSYGSRLSNSYSVDPYRARPVPSNSIAADLYSSKRYRPQSNIYNNNDLTTKRKDTAISSTTSNTATTTARPGKYRVSKADAENAKFAGAGNQEAEDESTKTLAHLQRKRFRNRCSLFGRDAATGAASNTTPAPKEQGRFLWDINVYNVYPNGGGGGGLFSDQLQQQSPLQALAGCGGFGGGLGGLGGFGGGGGGGGGLFSDPVAQAYPTPPLNNFLNLFAPGILQNALAATARPRPQFQADVSTGVGGGEVNDLQNDPEVDPGYNPLPARPIRRPPNRIYYDSAGAAPISPAQLVGGVATTVNGIIQQLTGNLQPVYQQQYRTRSYG